MRDLPSASKEAGHQAVTSPRLIACVTAVAVLGCTTACSKETGALRRSPVTSKEGVEAQAEPLARGSAQDVQAPRLCKHRVPAELCTKCNPELAAVFKETGDWCEEHGLPESHCYDCNPKLDFSVKQAAPSEAWCKEHGVPEAKCTKCNPKLIAKYIAANDYCREHGLPESVCPYCHPELLQGSGHELPVFPKPGTKVRLASAATERDSGIRTTIAKQRPFAKTIHVIGQLHFNENRLAKLSARSEAVVVDVKVDIGDEVKRGQAVVTLASAGVGEDQARLVAARTRLATNRAALEREETLLQDGIASKRTVEQSRAELATAEADFEAVQSALRAAGASRHADAGGHYVLTAPFDGTVVAREVVAGRSVSRDTVLLEVADLSSMWAVLEIPEAASADVRTGQPVSLTMEGVGLARQGTVSRMGASVDPHTRTVRARADVSNPDRALRAGLFIRAKVEVVPSREALLLPKEAVQQAENQTLVFIRNSPGVYDPVPVQLGASTETEVEVVSGIEVGAEVVTTGAFVLKTEILKDSIGAGCADDH